MSFVTLTDHNTIDGALQLKAAHPHDTFVSVETTTYFPEDGCKIHLLIFGIDEKQFAEIERRRDNIYNLRDYLRENRVPCSVAHASFSINGKLTPGHLEKLLLLFNVFEGINGARPSFANNIWKETLETLTPSSISSLSLQYGITPWGDAPWMKGFTGGSDDHAGFFIGATATCAPAETVDEFLSAIADGRTNAMGRHNDFKGMAFSIYKIAWDFYKHRSEGDGAVNDFLKDISGLIFDRKPLGAKNWLTLQHLKLKKNEKNGAVVRFFEEITAGLGTKGLSLDEQHERIYQSIATLVDDYFGMIFKSAEKDLRKGNAFKLIKDLSAALPGIFLSMPFLSTLHHMASNRSVLEQCFERVAGERLTSRKEKRVLWFSDTLNELNGISETLASMLSCADDCGKPVMQVVAIPDSDVPVKRRHEVLNLPFIYEWKPAFYDTLTIRFPSLLKSLEIIQRYGPDEIIISTPGPVGLTGLLAAKLLSLKCTAIYHTDFTRQAALFLGDDTMTNLTETYMRWFHSQVDTIRVPTGRYITMLGDRGYQTEKMKLFKRGINADTFRFSEEGRKRIREELGLGAGPVFLWAGRVGKEKSLDLLAGAYKDALRWNGALTLIIAGDGPIVAEVKADFADCPRVIFTGRIPHDTLPWWYSAADAFVFPSVTDTFGMVVLEAQACSLPALVSDIGGPQEIIENGKTGYVVRAHDREAWADAIVHMAEMTEREPERHLEMRYFARKRIEENATWKEAVFDLLGPPLRKRDANYSLDAIPSSLLPHPV
jgi:glycosyltransferase involved in cell wall biosynthesis